MSDLAVPAIAIEVKGLTKKFGDVVAVNGLDMTVPEGVIYGFLGSNGSGKTTTIRMMCGLLTPDGGEGQTLGYDILTEGQQIKERIGYMTQRFSLYEELSVRENLDFMARMYGVANRCARIADIMEEYGLTVRAEQIAGTLSGGWKQRLALATAMLHSPRLLLLDEPTAGVDPAARRDFWDRIRGMTRQGVTVLVSTHYMDEAVQCDHICFIFNGCKLIDAPASEVPARSGLHTVRIEGTQLAPVLDELKSKPGVEQVTRFGDALHVSSLDETALAAAVAPYRGREGAKVITRPTGLEEAFIHFIDKATKGTAAKDVASGEAA
jgi:ABC-2 type transport system ATP-binding protein